MPFDPMKAPTGDLHAASVHVREDMSSAMHQISTMSTPNIILRCCKGSGCGSIACGAQKRPGAGLAKSSHLSVSHLHIHAVAVQHCMQRSVCLPPHNCSSRDAITRSFFELPASLGLQTARCCTHVSTCYHTPRLAMQQVQAASIWLALLHLPSLVMQYLLLPNVHLFLKYAPPLLHNSKQHLHLHLHLHFS